MKKHKYHSPKLISKKHIPTKKLYRRYKTNSNLLYLAGTLPSWQ